VAFCSLGSLCNGWVEAFWAEHSAFTKNEAEIAIINRMLDVLRAEQDPFADPFAEREVEIAIINRMLEELKARKKRLDEQANNEMNKRLAEIRAGIDQPTDESPKSSKVEIIGIGARLIDVNGACTIAELIPGGPAEKSKQLEPKDVILKVSKSDGTLADIGEMKLAEIVELIKGPKNSKVKLLIQPFKNPSIPIEVSIKRKPLHIYHQIQ
jgi:C-terminal processing protease CtpA/Prc